MAKPYDSIPDRRDIIRRRALSEQLERLVEDRPAGEVTALHFLYQEGPCQIGYWYDAVPAILERLIREELIPVIATVGVDEAGRGPVLGPLVVAGVAIESDVALRHMNVRDSKKLSPDDIAGGTFTLTNPGMFGNILSTPIINQPQLAIMTTGAIVKRPVVRDGEIVVRDMMYLSLSFDHRLIDGGTATRTLSFSSDRQLSFRYRTFNRLQTLRSIHCSSLNCPGSRW